MAAVIGVGNRCLRRMVGGREGLRKGEKEKGKEKGKREKKKEVTYMEKGGGGRKERRGEEEGKKLDRAAKWKRTERRNACRGTS